MDGPLLEFGIQSDYAGWRTFRKGIILYIAIAYVTQILILMV